MTQKRDRWSSRAAFVFAAVGSAVGIGNVWRFPWLCYSYGGGAFFIPYLLALFLIGIPILALELSLGQVFQASAVNTFNRLHKRLRGVGFAAVYGALIISTYYSVLIAYTAVYFFQSFQNPLPWAVTDDQQAMCSQLEALDCQANSLCRLNESTGECGADFLSKASDHFFNDVLRIADPSGGIGGIAWWLISGTAVVWVVTFSAIFRGAFVTGKVAVFTMTAPVVLLIVLMIRGVTLPGAMEGVRQYIGEWDLSQLVNRPETWSAAVGQIFFSIGISLGVMPAYGSYNNKHQRVTQDTVIIALTNSIVSFIAGFAVFSIAGFLAYQANVHVDDLPMETVGLIFMTYPVGIAQLPAAQVFSVLFFMVLFLLGIDSQFSMVEAVVSVFHDASSLKNVRRFWVVLSTVIFGFCLSLFYCTDVGIHILGVVDNYLNMVSTVFVGLLQCIAAGWAFGYDRQVDAVGTSAILALPIGWIASFVVGNLLVFHPGNTVLGVCVGLGGLILSSLSALLLTNGKDREGKQLSWGSRAWWLYLGNIEELRAIINEATAGGSKFWKLPLLWSLLIKYLIPGILVVMLSITFSSEAIFGNYESLPTAYQATGYAIAFLSLFMIALGILSPGVYSWLLPVKADDKAKSGESLQVSVSSGDDTVDTTSDFPIQI